MDRYDDFASLFEFLPIGAYRSSPQGRQLRANPALARLNGFAAEAELLAAISDIAGTWYVDPQRRSQFMMQLEAGGHIIGFESEVHRYKTRQRIWISENAHVVRNADGSVRYYEGTVEEITDRVRARDALRHSQQQLRQIVELAPGMIYRVVILPGGQRRATFVSPGARALFGLEPEALLADGTLMHRLRHPDDGSRVQQESTSATLERRQWQSEFRVRLDSGEVKWVQAISAPAPADDDGNEVRVGIVHDISARKRAEQALVENGELWKRALESSGDGVWDWDLQTAKTTYSDALQALYGYVPGELGDDAGTIDKLAHADDTALMQRALDDHLAGRTPSYVNEHRIQCRNGQWKWILSRGFVISRNAAGAPLRMVGTHTDITADKQAAALRSERDRAAAADIAKSQFLSRVSHELRTPLNAILGFTQLIELDPNLGERQRGWIGQVLASGRHLLALMDDILDISSAQTGQLRIAAEPLALRPVVAETFEMLAGAARDAGVTLVDALPAGALSLHADRKRVVQIISNLISNAIKYNRRGGWVRVAVAAVAAAAGDAAALDIVVADSGAGIDAADQLRLFQPFERLSAHRGPVAGTGLGLALCRQLAEAMGGSITVQSEVGVGSAFTVRLPAA